MKKNNCIYFALIALAILISWNCSKNNNPLTQNENIPNEEVFNGKLEINTEKVEYDYNDVTTDDFIIVTAILTNTTQDTFYTKLGDGNNFSVDQSSLFIVKGSDGYFEKYSNTNKWNNLNLGIAVEGSKNIRILPSIKYYLQAVANRNDGVEGKYRLKVNYHKSNSETSIDTLKDASNIFTININ